jgi:hypothetical protein
MHYPSRHLSSCRALALATFLFAVPLTASAKPAVPSPHWTAVAPLAQARADYSAVLLHDQTTLVVGGGSTASGPGLASCERWDPTTGTWSSTGSMARARFAHTATVLRDGRVIAIGGIESFSLPLLSEVEIYDPTTGVWSLVAPIPVPRAFHAAVLLRDGRVLVVGGDGPGTGDTATALIYDPDADTWSAAGSMSVAREPGRFGAIVLADGDVLVAGGYQVTTGLSLAAADRYDVATGVWTTLPDLAESRNGNTLDVLPGGRVLVTGGKNGATIRSSTEVFDPSSNTWSAGPSLAGARWAHVTLRLARGKIVAVGGRTPAGDTTSCEVFDAATFQWQPFQALGTPRFKLGGTAITTVVDDDGRTVRRLLAIGGADGSASTTSVEEIVIPVGSSSLDEVDEL